MKLLSVVAGASALLLSVSRAGATTYYVAKSGADSNAGISLAAPFLTIQKAASVMVAGDTCYVRHGLYRETVTPAASGTAAARIIFAPYDAETVVVSGADVLNTSWSVHSGAIHMANATPAFRQLFVDGAMMNEARWPNAQIDNLLAVPRSRIDSATLTSLTDSDLPDLNLTGATLHLYPGNCGGEFAANTRAILSHDRAAHTLRWTGDASYTIHPGNPFYVYGKLELLDIPTEWHRDSGTGQLYLWTPDSASPAAHTVEYKARTHAFALDNRAYVTVTGFYVFAAGISMVNSTACVVDDCHLRYVQHVTTADWPYSTRVTNACQVSGAGNTWRNSSIFLSSQDGLSLGGTGTTVENCVIEDVSYYPGSYYASIAHRSGSGHIVRHNTLRRSGRYLDWPGGAVTLDIGYNDLSGSDLLTGDGGAIYAWTFNAKGTRVHHNWFHENEVGIYLDYKCENFVVYRNVSFDNAIGMQLSWSIANKIYNNTFVRNLVSIAPPTSSSTQAGTEVINCLGDGKMSFSSDCVRSNLGWFPPVGTDFVPQPGSAAIDGGAVVAGYTDGFTGPAPDIGAYEAGGEHWTPGASFALPLFPTVESTSAPPVPIGLAAVPAIGGIEISWTPCPTAVSGYRVKRAESRDGPFVPVGFRHVGAAFIDTSAVSGTEYYYQVSAVNSSGESAGSAIVAAVASVPAPWLSHDVGRVRSAGAAEARDRIFRVTGSGEDIGSTTDAFQFTHEPMVGDGSIVVRVTRVDLGGSGDKVGVMIRDSLRGDAPHAALVLNFGLGTPPPLVYFGTRATAGDGTSWTAGPAGLALPVWLKLTRAGNQFTGAVSTDGTQWTTVATRTLEMSATALAGFAVCSRNGLGARDVTTFEVVEAPWLDTAIGGIRRAGGAMFADGAYMLWGEGSGAGGGDAFNFAHKRLIGNGRIVVRLAALPTTGTTTDQAGLVMRDGRAADARSVAVWFSPTTSPIRPKPQSGLAGGAGAVRHDLKRPLPQVRFMHRDTAGEATSITTTDAELRVPVWLKLEREGDVFSAAISADGETWRSAGSATIAMPAILEIGLAVSAHNATRLDSVKFDNVTW